MPTCPTSVIRDISRDEYAALAKPFAGQWKRLFNITLIGGAPAWLFLLLIFGVNYSAILSNPNSPWMAHSITALYIRLWSFFVVLPVSYVIAAGSRIWSILGRSRARLNYLFPGGNLKATITTRLLPIGVVQTSAGSSTIVPWGNVVKIFEVSQGFILQTQNMPTMRWAANLENLYILRSNDPEEHGAISLQLLEEFHSSSELLPNYIWQAGLLGADNAPASQAIWPPPPASESPKLQVGFSLVGTIRLPIFEVVCDGRKLSVKYPPSAFFQRVSGTMILPMIFFFLNYRFLASSSIYIQIAVSLIVCYIFAEFTYQTNVYMKIDREASLITVHGKRFAAIMEIISVTVVERRIPGFLGAARKRAAITMGKTGGKSQRLPMLTHASAAETNLVAMIMGQFLTESLEQSQPNG